MASERNGNSSTAAIHSQTVHFEFHVHQPIFAWSLKLPLADIRDYASLNHLVIQKIGWFESTYGTKAAILEQLDIFMHQESYRYAATADAIVYWLRHMHARLNSNERVDKEYVEVRYELKNGYNKNQFVPFGAAYLKTNRMPDRQLSVPPLPAPALGLHANSQQPTASYAPLEAAVSPNAQQSTASYTPPETASFSYGTQRSDHQLAFASQEVPAPACSLKAQQQLVSYEAPEAAINSSYDTQGIPFCQQSFTSPPVYDPAAILNAQQPFYNSAPAASLSINNNLSFPATTVTFHFIRRRPSLHSFMVDVLLAGMRDYDSLRNTAAAAEIYNHEAEHIASINRIYVVFRNIIFDGREGFWKVDASEETTGHWLMRMGGRGENDLGAYREYVEVNYDL